MGRHSLVQRAGAEHWRIVATRYRCSRWRNRLLRPPGQARFNDLLFPSWSAVLLRIRFAGRQWPGFATGAIGRPQAGGAKAGIDTFVRRDLQGERWHPRITVDHLRQVEWARRLFCRMLPRTVPQLRPSVIADPRRAAAIISTNSKWVDGTVLHYGFLSKGHFAVPGKQADAFRAAFKKWKAVGIGLEFKEVSH
jgi:hypothetical protein